MATIPVPILASTLYASITYKQAVQPSRYPTGCKKIDECLRGGFAPGEVVSLSGDTGTGKTVIALQCLVSFLLSSPTSQAAIIDTTGTFDVMQLHHIISSRLQRPTTMARDEFHDQDPKVVLDRVRIMRVFDLVGVSEAVHEVRESLDKTVPERPETVPRPMKKQPLQRVRSAVADSEDEDEDMLFMDTSRESSPTAYAKAIDETERTIASPKEEEASKALGSFGMIIIDNISQAISPLMKRNYVQAHSLMIPFLRSLTNLTRSHNLVTILINSSTDRILSNHQKPQPAPPKPSPSVRDKNHYSVFASNTLQPLLGRTFPHHVDLHLLLSSLPKKAKDVKKFYDTERTVSGGDVEVTSVIEVVGDKNGGLFGRWTTFTVKGVMGELLD